MQSEPTTAAEVLERARATRRYFASLRPPKPAKIASAPAPQPAPAVTAPEPVPPPLEPPKPVKIPHELAVQLANIAKPNAWKLEEDEPTIRPTIMFIIKHIAERYGLTVADLQSARRNKRLVWIRQIAYYVCKTMTTRSLLQIASSFGGRDHTTALSGITKVESVLAVSEELRAEIKLICAEISAAVVDRRGNYANPVDGSGSALPTGLNMRDSKRTSRHGDLPSPRRL